MISTASGVLAAGRRVPGRADLTQRAREDHGQPVMGEVSRRDVSTGTVKWFDPTRGFGRVTDDAGSEVHVHVSALPDGMTTLEQGTRVAFDITPGKPGSRHRRARTVQILSPAVGILRTPTQTAAAVDQAITLLDDVSAHLRHGRYPDRGTARTTATMLRGVADALHRGGRDTPKTRR